ncbi:hypothetical protein DFH08DRAFT_1029661, partial [Mycena albidolilacea]
PHFHPTFCVLFCFVSDGRSVLETRSQHPTQPMERRPEMGRPSAGSYWLSLAMSAAVLLFLLWLIRLDWLVIGFWFGDTVVEGMMRWIRWREWKEARGNLFWYSLTTLSGALVVPLYLSISRQHSMLITWIAAHIYFVWSPDLTAHTGFVGSSTSSRLSMAADFLIACPGDILSPSSRPSDIPERIFGHLGRHEDRMLDDTDGELTTFPARRDARNLARFERVRTPNRT